MTLTSLAPDAVFRGVDGNGNPLSGGKLFQYAAGTTTKLATYTDSTGATQNTNPIILNSRGECNLWLAQSIPYKLVLSPSTDSDPPSTPFWTVDNVTSVPSGNTVNSVPVTVVAAPLPDVPIAAVTIAPDGAVPLGKLRWPFPPSIWTVLPL